MEILCLGNYSACLRFIYHILNKIDHDGIVREGNPPYYFIYNSIPTLNPIVNMLSSLLILLLSMSFVRLGPELKTKFFGFHLFAFKQSPPISPTTFQYIFIRQPTITFIAPVGSPRIANSEGTFGFFVTGSVDDLLIIVITHHDHGLSRIVRINDLLSKNQPFLPSRR